MARTDLVDVTSFARTWDRFASRLLARSPADHATLRGPATEESIAELEARLGFALHPELKSLLARHDGADATGATGSSAGDYPVGSFLPLGHRLSGVDDIEFMHEVLVDVGEENIAADLWERTALAVNLHWCVPFALPVDGGVAFVDHRPGATYGHVHEMGIGAGDLEGTRWATSLTELFQVLGDALETDAPFPPAPPGSPSHG